MASFDTEKDREPEEIFIMRSWQTAGVAPYPFLFPPKINEGDFVITPFVYCLHEPIAGECLFLSDFPNMLSGFLEGFCGFGYTDFVVCQIFIKFHGQYLTKIKNPCQTISYLLVQKYFDKKMRVC